MSDKPWHIRAADRAELWITRRFGGPQGRPVIDPYSGYQTPEGVLLRGRVLTSLRRQEARADASWWINLRQMLSLFLTDEVANVRVAAGGIEVLTDAEGYFHLMVPVPEGARPEYMSVTLPELDTSADIPIYLRSGAADFGVISDIDDTMMETGAYSLARNLWTSLTGNALTRRVYPDAVSLMDRLSDNRRNPIFYVSSSPWNLHDFLIRVFVRHELPLGPMFLRDLGVGGSGLGGASHGDHKGSAIDRIMAANPDLSFVLVGDTGQHDAYVYRDAIARHPGRITRVILREPGAGADDHDKVAMNAIADAGVQLDHGANYNALIEGMTAQNP